MRRKPRKLAGSQLRAELLEVRTLPATFFVTSLADNVANDGVTTLREAFNAANEDTAEDTIRFADGLTGVIQLTEGPLQWRTSIRIEGNGQDATIIDGGGTGDIFYSDGYFASPGNDGNLTLQSLTLRNARHAVNQDTRNYPGGVTIEDSTISGHTAAGVSIDVDSYDGYGGRARLTIRNSTITGNATGVRAYSGVQTLIEDSTISSNTSGGISSGGYSEGFGTPRLTIVRSVISDNTGRNGAGINAFDGSLDLIESLVAGNIAQHNGGGVHADGSSMVMRRTTLTDNTAGGVGGGIYADYGVIENSTISGNLAEEGGGAMLGRVTLANSTVTENHASGRGGGVSSNREIESSIIAGNTTDGEGPDIHGDVVLKHSLLGDNSGTDFEATGATEPDADGNLIGDAGTPIDPKLGPLQSVGVIAVHPLSQDSPAVDLGTNPRELDSDQAGGPRIRGAAPDMGAVEEGLRPFLVGTSLGVTEGSDGTVELRFQLSLSIDAAGPFTVEVSTRDGSATLADNDYIRKSATLSFDGIEGETHDFIVQINGDRQIEGDEFVLLHVDSISDPAVAPPVNEVAGSVFGDDMEGLEIELEDKVLSITTFETDDVIELELENNELHIDINGSFIDYRSDEVDSIVVRTNGGADSIVARLVAASMFVDAGAGDDTVKGGLGNDTLFGSDGNDRVRGTKGDDQIDGGDGDDLLQGQDGNDTLWGQDGTDTLQGSDGDDQLAGGNLNDQLSGGEGNDLLYGGGGDDTLFGGDGDDSLEGQGGQDLLHGEAGNDRLNGAPTLNGIMSTLVGGGGNDWLTLAGVMRGGGGDDLLEFAQRMSGGSGNDTLIGNFGPDYLNGGPGADVLDGDHGADTLLGRGGNDILMGGQFGDLITGAKGRDIILGGRGRDTINGNGGDDLVISGYMRNSLDQIAHLKSIQQEWVSDRSYTQRVANIRDSEDASSDRLNTTFLIGQGREGENVFSNGKNDSLNGGNQRDFFFAQLSNDLDDRTDDELLEQIQSA